MVRFASLLLACSLLNPAGASADSEKIVYHLHELQPGSLNRALSNLENLSRGMPGTQLDVRLLLQGSSIRLLDPALDKYNRQRLQALRQNGVRIEVSRRNYEINRDRIDRQHPPHQVANIFGRIVELEQQGYKYVTP